jgi:simple sugar transport system permease protein
VLSRLLSAWRPFWLLIGAWFFGALMYLSLYVQALGVAVPSALLSAVPYIGTVVVLVLISRDARRIRLYRPAMLGRAVPRASVGISVRVSPSVVSEKA